MPLTSFEPTKNELFVINNNIEYIDVLLYALKGKIRERELRKRLKPFIESYKINSPDNELNGK